MAFDIIALFIIVMIVSIPIILFVFFLVNKNSYRHTVWIARQTGKNFDDVIWIPDKFKLRNVNGSWEVKFYTIREKTPSIDGRFWTKTLNPAYVRKIVKFDKLYWDNHDMSRQLKRGLMLYETTEGEFYPMGITKDNSSKTINLTTFNQDNRMFVANETQSANSLTRNKNQDKLMLWGIIIGIVGIIIVSGVIGYFQNKNHEENIAATAQICGQYTVNIINALTNPNSTKPQFISDIKPILDLPKG